MVKKLKLLILRGLPASGKTTYARELVQKGWVRVEKDVIRLDGRLFKDGVYNHKRGDESLVLKERNRLIREALAQGKNVVSSDTNLNPKHVTGITAIAREYSASVKQKDFLDVPIAELIKRDAERENTVGEQVIRKMFHDFVKKMPTFLKYDPNLPFVVVSDLDGTLTLGPKDRSPYEWHKVGNDDINLGVAHMLDGVSLIGHAKLFIFSGRDEVCLPETEAWLEKNDIEYNELHMRRSDHYKIEGDPKSGQAPDTDVKAEMIDKYIKGKYNVLFWFDDRVAVANMLRDVYGINVAQLGDPNYKF
jgi:predicted kinase